MKTWIWLPLTILTLMAGCAPGASVNRGVSRIETTSYEASERWTQNQEGEGQQEMRIWREDAGR
jgi:hypothetical protein